ncbi:AraC family transcriptional regulator [Pseudomonas stutzeri]|uniref:AraC family transcriptional regulator n=1 Tax=Stutzerimonas stutzeri TaxID=316 RepID=UPI001F52362B|nr:helix-turn-helix domain-containing protein [Stutzerimonas stutzeri]MCI0918182.1 AraC family transcriptional regulator [Stutzerimonas stutzeri]
MAINHLLIGRACLIVRAASLPNGYNQRPGVTLLLADGAPLELEIDGQTAVTAHAWLLAPEIRRRFVRPQPHFSITVEPSHPSYVRLLRWARLSHGAAHRFEVTEANRLRLAGLTTQPDFDAWLDDLLTDNHQPAATANPRLEHLLSLVKNANIETSAEQIWQAFRLRYPSTQAHCSHWLQDNIGIPLRKLLLWQKLRRALEAVSSAQDATEAAHAAGFADSAHLSRICLRTFGLRPSQANDHKILQVNRFPDY